MRAAGAAVAALAALALGACSFVQMGPGADEVRVVGPAQLPAGCVKRGVVEVSVKDRLGPYERDELRVKDELEVLARNEAPSLDADTIQPEGPPRDGEQRFVAYRCGAAAPASASAPERVEPAEAETAPLEEN